MARGGGTTIRRQQPDRRRPDRDETEVWLDWLRGGNEEPTGAVPTVRAPDRTARQPGSRDRPAPRPGTRDRAAPRPGTRDRAAPRPGPAETGYHRSVERTRGDSAPPVAAPPVAAPPVADPSATDQFALAETDGRGYRADGYRADGYQVDGYRDDGYWGPAQPEPEPAPQRRGHVALLDGEAGRQRMARMPVAARQPMAGNRLFLLILFWVMLAVSVELWWADAPGRSIGGVAGLLIGVGRITGMAGGFTLLVQILLMSRVAWLEQWIGAHDLLIWHRWLGTSLMVLIPAHAVFLIFGYAAEGQTSAAGETILMLRTYPAMISAFVATGLLVSIGILAIRAIRRHLPYEVWYYLHLTSYLVLLWGYGHQFAAGADLVQGGFARRYWFGLYMLVIVSLAWGRVVEPLWLNLRHRFRVLTVVPEAPNMVSIYIGGNRLDRLEAKAGQYFRWRFLTRRGWYQAHPFSLSAAPNDDWLRLTVKVVGDHTDDLQYLRPGSRVFAEGPSGAFTADRRVNHGALLIAGGSGIAPIRALLEDLPAGTIVLYRASTADDLVFREELEALAHNRGAWVWYVLGSRDDPATRHAFSPAGMRKLVPDLRHRDVYLCGPQGIISASVKSLRRMRVPKKHIHLDPFEF